MGSQRVDMAEQAGGCYLHKVTQMLIGTLGIFFFFWPCLRVFAILAPQPGIKPMPSAVEAWSLNHWPPGNCHSRSLNIHSNVVVVGGDLRVEMYT